MMKQISAEAFDKKFDNNEDIDEYIDWKNAKKVSRDYINTTSAEPLGHLGGG